MRKVKEIFALIVLIFFLAACSTKVTTLQEDYKNIITEIIMMNEYSEYFKIRYINYEYHLSSDNLYVYHVYIDLDEEIFDEYNPLGLEQLINSIPLKINEEIMEDLFIETDYEEEFNIEIEELKILYDALYTVNQYGIFYAGSRFDPVAQLEKREEFEALKEEASKNLENFTPRRFDAQMMILGNTYVFKNKTKDEINDEYRRIYSENLRKSWPNLKDSTAPPIDWSKVYIRKEYKN